MLFLLLVLGSQFSAGEEPAPDKLPKEEHAETDEEPVVTDPAGNPYFPKGRDSHSVYYKAANLPSMLSMRVNKGEVRFRVGFFPSFARPLFLSYARDKDQGIISVARLSGRLADGQEPGKIEMQGAVEVKPEDAAGFETRAVWPEVREPLKALDERLLPHFFQVADGEEWLLEVVTSDGYTLTRIQCPQEFKFYEKGFRVILEDIRKGPQKYRLPESFRKYEFPALDVSEFNEFCKHLLLATDMGIPSRLREHLPAYPVE
ncbi:MAG: hypothetical protein EOP88_14480 [Verrucomicrobiaceae bacterium]|nr:MAG: hypothetical protein EOP88_14480 [Verrucomicrobiaceae bacterium]